MKVLFSAGSVAVLLAALAFVGPSGSAAKPPRPPRGRVAILNLGHVFLDYNRNKEFQRQIKDEIDRHQIKEAELAARVPLLLEQPEDAWSAAGNAEVLVKLNRDQRAWRRIERADAAFEKAMVQKSDEQMVIVYRDVHAAVQRYARANDIELVLQYNSSGQRIGPAHCPDRADFPLVELPVACVPLYAAPGVDISEEIIAALNDSLRSK
jgi:Skp family chaperone for outer membrane proteins